jgi:hypothetical protein
MELKDYIEVSDNVVPYPLLSKFLEYLNLCKFVEAKTIGENEDVKVPADKKFRNTYIYPFRNDHPELSNVHWHNLLGSILMPKFLQYGKKMKCRPDIGKIIDISALRYDEGCFYKLHTDHHTNIPRTLSMIFLLNNDYEGGELVFEEQYGNDTYTIETKPNRVIVWSSSFLFPHQVKKVTKGTRYSIVSWAL